MVYVNTRSGVSQTLNNYYVLKCYLVEVCYCTGSILGRLEDEWSTSGDNTRGYNLEVDVTIVCILVEYVNGSIAECLRNISRSCLEWQNAYVPGILVYNTCGEGNVSCYLLLGELHFWFMVQGSWFRVRE